jgi:hypothetical protein
MPRLWRDLEAALFGINHSARMGRGWRYSLLAHRLRYRLDVVGSVSLTGDGQAWRLPLSLGKCQDRGYRWWK